jgi:hypothetical protein
MEIGADAGNGVAELLQAVRKIDKPMSRVKVIKSERIIIPLK